MDTVTTDSRPSCRPVRVSNPNSGSVSNTVVAAIVTVLALALGFVGVIATVGVSEATTPLVTTVLGFVGTALLGLLVLVKSEKAERSAVDAKETAARTETEVRGLTNGKLTESLRVALEEQATNRTAVTDLFKRVAEIHQQLVPTGEQVEEIHDTVVPAGQVKINLKQALNETLDERED